jgi:hypothetical protein
MRRSLLSMAAALLIAAAPGPAQNAFSATYDNTRQIKLSGIVTRIEWTNPHAYIFVSTKDASGTISSWAVEVGNPLELERSGWKSTTVRVGDSVSVEGLPARGMKRQAFAKSVTRNKAKIFTLTARRPAASREPAPRWPGGRVSLGPPAGKKGYWEVGASSALYDSAAGKIAMNDEGLLMNLADIDRIAPMQPWARSVYEYRQRTLLKDDPFPRCLPPGGPRQFQTPHGLQFVEQPELGRILVLLGGGDRNWRVIFTDGRPQGQADEVVRSYYGNSVGKWDGDTLTVDVIGFNEKFWFANGGLPHTEALHLVERFTRPDLSTLQYEVTVDDPRTYTRPWKGGWALQWVPNEEIQEYFCEENAEQSFIR